MQMFRSILGLAVALLAVPAFAQLPASRTFDVKFTGVVTNDVSDTIMIRQPDGSSARYQGPVPQYEYRTGDQVTIGFTTTVPTSAYYNAANTPVPADGLYRIAVNGPIGNPNAFGVARNFDVSGSLRPAPDFGVGGITIVYDLLADTYSLEFPTGQWTAGYLSGPSYTYDAATGSLLPSSRNCFTSACEDGSLLRGTDTSATLTTQVGSANEPSATGSFKQGVDGTWSLPTYRPTPVPEPGTMLLFGGGVAALMLRRRRAAAR